MSPFGSRNGPRSSRFESFGTVFLSPPVVSTFNSAGKASFCSALIVTWPACFSSAADGGEKGIVGVFECSLSLNPFISRIRLAIASFTDNQLERRLNLEQPMFCSTCDFVAQTTTSRYTSGSFSSSDIFRRYIVRLR